MRRLDRYIGRTVLSGMAVVLLVLGGLDLLFTGIAELGETTDEYAAADALRYVLLTFPRHIYELLPMMALVGTLAGLGVLAAGNELIAIQTAGIRRISIVKAVMLPAGFVMLLGLLLGEVIAPPLEVRGEEGKALASGNGVALSRYGYWERDDEAFLHFNAIDPDGILYGVSIFEFDDRQRMVRRVTAEQAVYRAQGLAGEVRPSEDQSADAVQASATNGASTVGTDDTSGNWVLLNGLETRLLYEGDEVSSVLDPFASRTWNLNLTPDLLELLIIDPDRMAISDLWQYAQRFERQGQDARPYYLSFWKKLLQPVTTGVLVLLAISFIFGPLREATMGSRVFTAISFGLVFTILQNLLHTVSLVYQFNPLGAVLLPLLLCAGLGLLLFRRAA